MHRTNDLATWLKQASEAGLAGDRPRLQLVLLSAIRSLRKTHPTVAESLGQLLSQHIDETGSLRWKDAAPPPTEGEEGMSLVRLPTMGAAMPPVLPADIQSAADQFVTERQEAGRLLKEGFAPPSTLLLVGAPGTGKTMLARWLSSQLNVPLVVQDLATSISSLLGKTGLNLRRTLDYARSHPCLLLLDEFDAIAKRRDDAVDLGELKRIVNVLLKELEDWPYESLIVAATNHPDLLDPAIYRRFHVTLHLRLPDDAQRKVIMKRVLGHFEQELHEGIIDACCNVLEGSSGSDIDRITQAAVRRHISCAVALPETLIAEVVKSGGGKDVGGTLIRSLREVAHHQLTVRDIARLVGKSASTVQHHLKKEISYA